MVVEKQDLSMEWFIADATASRTTDQNNDWPLVSIITVNYNQSGVTLEFLQSLRECTYPNFEVFIVDNGSPNDNPLRIKEAYPEINLCITHKNLGFAGGNNVALSKVSGKYLLFINNDTEVEPDFLQPLVQLLESDPTIGMVSPKIHFFHNPLTFQFAGFTPLSRVTIRNKAIGFGEKDVGQYDMTVETGSIFGAAMLVPRKVIETVGPMSEVYFLYYEEHDWAEHIRKSGFSIYYCGQSLVRHKESISTVKESPFQIFYLNRGRIIFARRNRKGFWKLVSMAYLMGVAMPKSAFKYWIKGRKDLSAAIWKALWWNISTSKKQIQS